MWGICRKLLRKMWFLIRNPLIFSLFCETDWKFLQVDSSYQSLAIREKYSPKWALRTSLLAYEKNEASKTINIPLYMLFALGKELKFICFLLWVRNWKQKARNARWAAFLAKLSPLSCYFVEKENKKWIFIIKCRSKCYFSRKKFGGLLNNV